MALTNVHKLLVLLLVTLVLNGCSSYRDEEVTFRNSATVLRGTIYVPSRQGPHPAIIFVGGSGRAPRENVRWFAEYFASYGVAALIYDKRDIGSVRGTELVSGEELAGDVLAGVQLLKTRADIDGGRIGLWGGSQGAGVAARAAAQSDDIAFLISVSGGGVTYEELAVYQNAHRLRAQGFSEEEIQAAETALRGLYEYVRTRKDPEAAQAALDRAWQKGWAPSVLPTRSLPTDEELKTWSQWREFDRPSVADWERVTVPVLAFWGERDDVVPVKQSAERIREALKRAGNQDVTVVIVEGADHNLMRQPNPQNMPAQEYLDAMISWTLKRTRVGR